MYDHIINIPQNTDVAFELTFIDHKVFEYSEIFEKHGIEKIIPYWGNTDYSINLGLMYFNNDELKNELVSEFKKVQKFRCKKKNSSKTYKSSGTKKKVQSRKRFFR